MSKIKIRNFGPIKNGYQENNGWLEIKKVTVFIGNQGSGKSTLAKAISTLTWMEKALSRGDVTKNNLLTEDLYEHFEYQKIEAYFKEDTLIDYQGEFAHIVIKKHLENCTIEFTKQKQLSLLPKIMYVPAERNFLTVIRDAYNVTNLPAPLKTFGEELKKSMLALNENILDLPIGQEKLKYDRSKDKISLLIGDFDLPISDASSGYQSFVPLYAVTKYLSDEVEKSISENTIRISTINRTLRRHEEVQLIKLNSNLSNYEKEELLKEIDRKYFSSCLINIVEEPEQNLFPASQKSMLESLIKFNNINEGNRLIMTTHSPYLINYLTLAVKANEVFDQLKNVSDNKSEIYLERLSKVVPHKSMINQNNLIVYELNENDGTIKKLETFNGLPSDDNYLNVGLAESNELFAQLLEIQQAI